jgi:hypothetical protein
MAMFAMKVSFIVDSDSIVANDGLLTHCIPHCICTYGTGAPPGFFSEFSYIYFSSSHLCAHRRHEMDAILAHAGLNFLSYM